MKHISILVPHEAVMASVVDPRTILTGVNEFLLGMGKPAVFDVQLVGLTKQVKLTDGHFSVHTDALLEDVKETDLLIVPALGGDLKNSVTKKFSTL